MTCKNFAWFGLYAKDDIKHWIDGSKCRFEPDTWGPTLDSQIRQGETRFCFKIKCGETKIWNKDYCDTQIDGGICKKGRHF